MVRRGLDGARRFKPALALDVNWATSGPGFEWPEVWHSTTIAELQIYVVTASRDSEDAYGCTDHAIGWWPTSISRAAATRELIEADWRHRRDQYDQARWKRSLCGGFLRSDTVEAMAAAVWIDD